LFFVKQQAFYGVAFTAFLAASAIHNERRSRRILAVLAKGIERGQYLAGLITGVLLAAVLYCLFVGVFGSLMFRTVGLPQTALWYLLALVIVSCALAATTAMLFATFAPPLVAIALTAIALGSGFGVAVAGLTRNFLPVGALMASVTRYDLHSGLPPHGDTIAWGVAQSLILWLLASWIFARRDIAVAVE
jgi:ABC-type transport system involved in multi-copper enzyme maturation permease subunit